MTLAMISGSPVAVLVTTIRLGRSKMTGGSPARAAVGTMPTAVAALATVPCSPTCKVAACLTRLGMGVAFSPAADFSALSPQACCIGLVEHSATLDVGEKGTVASAATAVGVQATAGHVLPPQVRFDRPYLMLVTDRMTGEPLFMARVTDPATR